MILHEKRDGFHRREEVRGKGAEKGGKEIGKNGKNQEEVANQ